MTPAPLFLGSDLRGRVVVGLADGDDLAEVRDVIFDPAEQRLVGFTLNKRGWFSGRLSETLPADSIRAIGPDAVMIERADHLVDQGDGPEALTGSADAFDITRTRVLSGSGEDLGVIDDVVIEAGPTPQVVGYRLAGDNGPVFVPITAQQALSEDNIVLPEAATQFVRHDLSGFGAAVAGHRSSLDLTPEESS